MKSREMSQNLSIFVNFCENRAIDFSKKVKNVKSLFSVIIITADKNHLIFVSFFVMACSQAKSPILATFFEVRNWLVPRLKYPFFDKKDAKNGHFSSALIWAKWPKTVSSFSEKVH